MSNDGVVLFCIRDGDLRKLQETFFSWDTVKNKNLRTFQFELDPTGKEYNYQLEEVKSFIQRNNVVNYQIRWRKKTRILFSADDLVVTIGERVPEDILAVSQ